MTTYVPYIYSQKQKIINIRIWTLLSFGGLVLLSLWLDLIQDYGIAPILQKRSVTMCKWHKALCRQVL